MDTPAEHPPDPNVGPRIIDRRHNPFAYGSPEWRGYLRRQGLPVPDHDRRQPGTNGDGGAPPADPRRRYVRILLSPAEKKLLADIYLGDDGDCPG